ncbi:hypothetical protein [Mangrovimonas aestuarii]|uniref:hypothetical protein n=1 Tax=Mangrovimonas aestuarii TaxID=3018443 RepID=UPI002379F506|nr:hypothetical protein [Mangrovimonas aestuarii]
MTIQSINKPPVWYWIVSVLALIWNLLGVHGYIQQAYNTPEFRAMYNEEQLVIIDNTPAWAMGAFAVAVFTAVLGCICLLLRKKWAKPLFLISLIAVIVQMSNNLFVTKNYFEVFDSSFVLSMVVMIPIIALLLIWLSNKAIAKQWIN